MYHDGLTGAVTRQALLEELIPLMGGEHVVLMVDLDHFKTVKDSFGHLVGDEALKHLTRVLKERVRPGDVVCRWGGEEFLVILRGVSREQARAVGLRPAFEFQPAAIDRRAPRHLGRAFAGGGEGDGVAFLAIHAVHHVAAGRLEALAEIAPDALFVPLAVEYTFWDERGAGAIAAVPDEAALGDGHLVGAELRVLDELGGRGRGRPGLVVDDPQPTLGVGLEPVDAAAEIGSAHV